VDPGLAKALGTDGSNRHPPAVVSDLPTGTVTLLFTDIEGATRLLREHGDGYEQLLAEHRRALREIVGAYDGREVDTQGDSFFFAFRRASDAVDAAGAAQRGLADGPVRIRVGIHTGEPTATREGYVGIDVHTAARVCAAAHGGQVLVTAGTRELIDAETRDLGSHRLKDLDGPLRLYQLGSGEFPAPRTLSATNLPVPSAPLLGRDAAVAAAHALIAGDEVRLLTITGPGGMGKTRFALEVAAEFSDAFADGVWFVDLAPIRTPEHVLPTVGAAVAARGDTVDFLTDRELMLLLDNFEQVTEAAPDVARILAAARGVTVLVTSREPLRVSGEREFTLESLADEAAVELFRARALTVRTGFDAEFDELAEICRRLEGLPLAIELAAARAKILDAPELAARLEHTLATLSGGARDAPERQRTLRATIDWSYELLPEPERRLFAKLAVFSGGFTLEAAEEVCDADLDAVALLVDKNLVRRSAGRFTLLETLREYAAERLVDSGEQDDLEHRHARYYLALSERTEPELTGRDQSAWVELIAREHENLRAALDRFARADDGESVLRLSSTLTLFWFLRGFYSEGIEWLGRAIASSESRSTALAKALWGAGFLEVLTGEYESGETHLTDSLTLARELGDRFVEGRTLLVLGLLAFFQNDIVRTRSQMEEAVEIARVADDSWCLVDGLGTLSSIYPLQGELEKAERYGQESLELARRAHDEQGTRMALFGLALTAARRADYVRARMLAAEGLRLVREIGDRWFISYFLWLVGMASCECGDTRQARIEIEESLAEARAIGGALLAVCALEVLARIELADGNLEAARIHLDEALVVGEVGVPMSYTAAVHLTRGKLEAESGDLEAARWEVERSLELARECGDTWAENAAVEASASLD
jgi:predicted ATPase/class 3 adenylate cyclase